MTQCTQRRILTHYVIVFIHLCCSEVHETRLLQNPSTHTTLCWQKRTVRKHAASNSFRAIDIRKLLKHSQYGALTHVYRTPPCARTIVGVLLRACAHARMHSVKAMLDFLAIRFGSVLNLPETLFSFECVSFWCKLADLLNWCSCVVNYLRVKSTLNKFQFQPPGDTFFRAFHRSVPPHSSPVPRVRVVYQVQCTDLRKSCSYQSWRVVYIWC